MGRKRFVYGPITFLTEPHLVVEATARRVKGESMNWLEFVASIVGSLAWPLTAITIVVIVVRHYGRELRTRITRMRHFKAGPGGLELDFGEQVSELSEQAEKLPERATADGESQSVELREFAYPAIMSGATRSMSFDQRVEGLARIDPPSAVVFAAETVRQELVEAAVRAGLARQNADRSGSLPLIRHLLTTDRVSSHTAQVLERVMALRNRALHTSEESAAITYDVAMNYVRLAMLVMEALRAVGRETPPDGEDGGGGGR